MRTLDQVELRDALLQARQYTKAVVDDLDDSQWRVPRLDIVNPTLWELGHIGWFMEYWALRWRGPDRAPLAPIFEHADRWWDSRYVPHETRWDLDLPTRTATWGFLDNVLDAALEHLEKPAPQQTLYFLQLALYHEQMHAEAFAYTRQTCGYPEPPTARNPVSASAGEIRLEGGTFERGAPAEENGFVFDNEKWAHPETVGAFSVCRDLVTQRELGNFVDDDGYRRQELWSAAGRDWLGRTGAIQPRYWRRDAAAGWQARRFAHWGPIVPDAPMVHVTRFEAEAWCRWAARRLPSESEWEYAALAGAIGANAIWEWTASRFDPYPGFQPDPYAEYSQPWFGTHVSVRGGSWATNQRLLHPKFRNFYMPDRADIFVGFRTCALQ